ncbi:hypothetical protein LIN78_10825 [Leeia sp. TBRC 13508]|uniref:Uncharacterized protein n=1 Tax=Leeia speluncae TaxID=2884804 RepID=A0ABS8D8T0_9NEIS|nr:hypothetical protein [Leeia speluncae]MCB6184038.1 hypothetical protein [Leeia speluncae]
MWFEENELPEVRELTLPGVGRFQVPVLIERIDEGATHGWQLRYGEWTLFEDLAGELGASAALAMAVSEMTARIAYRGK